MHTRSPDSELHTPPHPCVLNNTPMSRLSCGYKIICYIYNIINMTVLLIENNLKFKFRNEDIRKLKQNKVREENAVWVKRLGNRCICNLCSVTKQIQTFHIPYHCFHSKPYFSTYTLRTGFVISGCWGGELSEGHRYKITTM